MPPQAPDCTCFLGTFLLHVHRETSTHQGLRCKMANKEGECFFFFFYFSQYLCESLSVKGCFYARNIQWQRNLRVNHSLLLLFWQTASTSDCLCQGHLALLPAPGERGMRATEHLSLGHRVPKSPLPTNPPLTCGFSVLLPLSPQTPGKVTNNYHVCHRDEI